MKYAIVAAVLMAFSFAAIGCSDDSNDRTSYHKTTISTPSGSSTSVETKVKSND